MKILGRQPVVELETAHQFFDAIQQNDRSTLERLCTPNAVVWHNYDRLNIPFSVVLSGLTKAAKILKDLTYAERRYTPLSDGVLAQHSLRGTLPTGQVVDVPMSVRVYMQAGRIHRFEEYLDPAQTAALASAVANVP